MGFFSTEDSAITALDTILLAGIRNNVQKIRVIFRVDM